MGVGELARRLSANYRDVRYVLEQGILPAGVDERPGRGEHRDLTPAQAFWLAIVLALKRNGVRAPLAGEIAAYTERAVQGVARNLNWDFAFAPFRGQMATGFQWFVECGDLEYIRLVTDASPSGGGQLEAFDWTSIATRRAVKAAAPLVVIRVDIARLAALLA